jgi:uncharacterized protein YkwD
VRLSITSFIKAVTKNRSSLPHKRASDQWTGIFPGLLTGLGYSCLAAIALVCFPFSYRVSSLIQDSPFVAGLSWPLMRIKYQVANTLDAAVKSSIGHVSVAAVPENEDKLFFRVSKPFARHDLELRMLTLVNEERAKNGLPILLYDPALSAVARLHSKDMFLHGYFAHRSPDGKDAFARMQESNISFFYAGENIALSHGLVMAHAGLMNSEGHRANILKPEYKKIGIGIMDGGIFGIMVTQNFRD